MAKFRDLDLEDLDQKTHEVISNSDTYDGKGMPFFIASLQHTLEIGQPERVTEAIRKVRQTHNWDHIYLKQEQDGGDLRLNAPVLKSDARRLKKLAVMANDSSQPLTHSPDVGQGIYGLLAELYAFNKHHWDGYERGVVEEVGQMADSLRPKAGVLEKTLAIISLASMIISLLFILGISGSVIGYKNTNIFGLGSWIVFLIFAALYFLKRISRYRPS